MIELWHEWNSVHSFKVRAVLAAKKLAWTSRRVELLKFEHLRPEYLRLNPNGVVPTLVHDGRVVLESSVICQYLDEAFAPAVLLPADAPGRARARTWLKYFDDVLHPAVRAASFELVYRPMLEAMPRAEMESRLAAHPDPSRARNFLAAAPGALERAAATFRTAIARIEAALAADWLDGSRPGLSDLGISAFAERLEHLGFGALWNGAPRAKSWKNRLLALPEVMAAGAPPEFRFPAPPPGRIAALLQ